MISKQELLQLRTEWQLDIGVIEKDYVLGWVLAVDAPPLAASGPRAQLTQRATRVAHDLAGVREGKHRAERGQLVHSFVDRLAHLDVDIQRVGDVGDGIQLHVAALAVQQRRHKP